MFDDILDWLDEHPVLSALLIAGSVVGVISIADANARTAVVEIDEDPDTPADKINIDVREVELGGRVHTFFGDRHGHNFKNEYRRARLESDIISDLRGETLHHAVIIRTPMKSEDGDEAREITIGVLNADEDGKFNGEANPADFLARALPGRFISGDLENRVECDGYGCTVFSK